MILIIAREARYRQDSDIGEYLKHAITSPTSQLSLRKSEASIVYFSSVIHDKSNYGISFEFKNVFHVHHNLKMEDDLHRDDCHFYLIPMHLNFLTNSKRMLL